MALDVLLHLGEFIRVNNAFDLDKYRFAIRSDRLLCSLALEVYQVYLTLLAPINHSFVIAMTIIDYDSWPHLFARLPIFLITARSATTHLSHQHLVVLVTQIVLI